MTTMTRAETAYLRVFIRVSVLLMSRTHLLYTHSSHLFQIQYGRLEGLLGVSVLTILQSVLTDLVGHATGAHGHVRHNVKAVVPCRFQVIDDVAGRVIANNHLVLFVV